MSLGTFLDKLAPVPDLYTMKAYREWGSKVLHILNLGNRCGKVVRFTCWLLYLEERALGIYWLNSLHQMWIRFWLSNLQSYKCKSFDKKMLLSSLIFLK